MFNFSNFLCSSFCGILQVTQLDLHRHFHSLGAGVIEDVRIQRDKGFGFVRYGTHNEAGLAIQMGNTQSYLYGKQIKVCLGTHLWTLFFFGTVNCFAKFLCHLI